MFGVSAKTGFEHLSTFELAEFIKGNRKYTKPAFSFEESEFEKAIREKNKRTKSFEFEAKKQSKENAESLQKQQETLGDILSQLARPRYKTANGWFSFIAMIAAIAGIALTFM